MTKEIIGFINKNNDIFNLKDDSSASKYCSKVGQGHENKIAAFAEDGDLKDSDKTIDDLVTKVHPSANGNLASLDVNGNLVDSGTNIGAVIEEDNTDLVPSGVIYNALQGKANKAINAISGHIASLDENGNLQDSMVGKTDIVLHQYDSISIVYNKNTNVYSWEDDSMGEEMLAVIQRVAPNDDISGIGIVKITDYFNGDTYPFISTISWHKEEIPVQGRELDRYYIYFEFGMTRLYGSIDTDGQSYYMNTLTLYGDHPIFSPETQIAKKIDITPATIGFIMGDPIEPSDDGEDLTELCRSYPSGKISPVLATITHHVNGTSVNTDVLGYFIPRCEQGWIPSVILYFGGYCLRCYTHSSWEDIRHWEHGDQPNEWDIELVKYNEIFEES